jgi:hypothetical protein
MIDPFIFNKLSSTYKVLWKNEPRLRLEISKFLPEATLLYLLVSMLIVDLLTGFQIGTFQDYQSFSKGFELIKMRKTDRFWLR